MSERDCFVMVLTVNGSAYKINIYQMNSERDRTFHHTRFIMKIAIGCDPNAQEAKEQAIKFIQDKGYGEVTDFGSTDPIYANVAIKVAEAVAAGEYDRGILICGTGIGVSISANKVKGAYAALCSDVYSAERARLSNDANIMYMGSQVSGYKNREEMITAFLKNEFVPGCRSQAKVDRYHEYDQNR
jgi:ribose 5-phosphate isomerase B